MDRLPDVGSEYEGHGGTIDNAIEFVSQNFYEMNSLWVRMQKLRVIKDKNRSVKMHNTIQYNTIQYNTIQYNTIQYNTIVVKGKSRFRLGKTSTSQHLPAKHSITSHLPT